MLSEWDYSYISDWSIIVSLKLRVQVMQLTWLHCPLFCNCCHIWQIFGPKYKFAVYFEGASSYALYSYCHFYLNDRWCAFQYFTVSGDTYQYIAICLLFYQHLTQLLAYFITQNTQHNKWRCLRILIWLLISIKLYAVSDDTYVIQYLNNSKYLLIPYKRAF